MNGHKRGPLMRALLWVRRKRFARKQNALTVIVPVQEVGLEPLRQCLQQIGDDIRNNPHIQFDRLRMPHFLSWVLVPGVRGEDGKEGCPRLMFEANFHGRVDDFLEELHQGVGVALKEKIYKHCGEADWCDVDSFKDFFRVHSVKPSLLFRSYPELSTRMIDNDDRVHWYLHEEMARHQRQLSLPPGTATAVGSPRLDAIIMDCQQSIQRAIRKSGIKDGHLLDFTTPSETWLARFKRGLLAKVLYFLPLIPSIIGALALLTNEVLRTAMADWVARRRKKGAGAQPVPPPQKARAAMSMDRIQQVEDRQEQNHLALYTELKPGLLRKVALRLILFGWDGLAKHFSTQGTLAGIEGIHFARWVIVDGGRRWWPAPREDGTPRRVSISRKRLGLLFLSNYDGSWESYLDNFIDRASLGLTTIWCNTEGFPKTRLRWNDTGRFPYFRIEMGAQREEEFKQWGRWTQVPTSVWYSRNPNKSVSNIRRNMELRARAIMDMDSNSRGLWLQSL